MHELVILSLGSNLGDREENLASAITLLGTFNKISNIKGASFYESEPLYNTDQPKFLNTIISCNSSLTPFEFLDIIKHIESSLGRQKERNKNQARIIDIDILCYGNSYLETDELIIPHPQLMFRKFVLLPFCELMPEYKIEKIGSTISELLSLCPDKTQVIKHIMEKNA